MTMGHMEGGRAFRNSNNPGGSRPGKPQAKWPWVLKIVADAIVQRAKGTGDSWYKDRSRGITAIVFEQHMDRFCPGWKEYLTETNGTRVSPWAELLLNRVFKMHYSGTSDRGTDHDPSTRAAMSREHWSYHFHVNHPLSRLHESVCRGQVLTIENWKEYL